MPEYGMPRQEVNSCMQMRKLKKELFSRLITVMLPLITQTAANPDPLGGISSRFKWFANTIYGKMWLMRLIIQVCVGVFHSLFWKMVKLILESNAAQEIQITLKE